ncbi:hypothetical protein Lal_00029673 [Lupinus albus]|nr:hypothetical protein Lal_00029673 [Lupinus albus]
MDIIILCDDDVVSGFVVDVAVASWMFADGSIDWSSHFCIPKLRDIWLECDSALVVEIFSRKGKIPWKLANKWHTCLEYISSMRFKVTHIYREGNTCAERLVAFGVYSQLYTWWDVTPKIILEEFNKNRLGLPKYRLNSL